MSGKVSEMRIVGALSMLYVFRMLGLFMVFPVMMIMGGQYQGATPLLLGIALGGYGITQAIFQIPLGLLSDVWGRKQVIYLGLGLFTLGSLLAATTDSIWGLILGRALQGSGAIAGAIMALVGDLTSEQNRTRAMAMIGISIGISFSIAMILGPFLAGFGGLPFVFMGAVVMALVSFAIVYFWVPTPPVLEQPRGSEGIAVPSLLSTVVKNIDLNRLYFGVFALHFALTSLFIVAPKVFLDSGVSVQSHWKFYLPTMLIAFVLMLPFMYIAERKRKLKQVFLGAIGTVVAAELFLTNATQTYAWVLGLLIFFIGFNLLEATLPSLVSKLAPAGKKGTAMGVFATSQFLGAAGGGFVGGYFLSAYGLSFVLLPALVICGVWFVLAFGMNTPKHLTSLCLPVEHPVDAVGLQTFIPGVLEAHWVQEQALLYLKVDDQLFKRDQLMAYLEKP